MKATFFSLAALAVSAFAAPAVEPAADIVARGSAEVARDQNADAAKALDDILVDKTGLGQIIDEATKNTKRDLSADELESTLSNLLNKVKDSGKEIRTSSTYQQ